MLNGYKRTIILQEKKNMIVYHYCSFRIIEFYFEKFVPSV